MTRSSRSELHTSNDDYRLSRGLWAVAVAFLSLGGLLTLDETPQGEFPQLSSAVASVDAGSVESGAGLVAGVENAAGSVEYLSKPIRELRTMRDRVLAHNPQREIGFDGWKMAGNQLTVANAQLAVSGDKGKYPEFAGNVLTVETRDFWRTPAESPRDQGFHYNGNAETYMLVGDALGKGMVRLHEGRK